MRRVLTPVVLAVLVARAGADDLVLTGGRVWTGDPQRPRATAVAIHDGRIEYVGDDAGALARRRDGARHVELGGRMVVPGFEDAHLHLMSGALSLERVGLIEDASVAAVQDHVRRFAAENKDAEWVLGRGWLYGAFPGGLPTREQLDAAVADRPAYMECYDGHTGWANSRALARAGITRETPDPPNGTIVRDPATGEPTGALKEAATTLVERLLPVPGPERRYTLLVQAVRQLNAQGITAAQDAGYAPAELEQELPLLERAVREDALTLKLRVSVRMSQGDVLAPVAVARLLAGTHTGPRLRFGAIKGFVDGVIEARTAAVFEPYTGAAGGLGHPNWDQAALDAAVTAADAQGLQVWLHAIGDRGVRMALDAHEAAARANGPRDRRPRIEHIETIAAADYPRFASLGVSAAMQPLHANPDQNNTDAWAANIGPERASRGFSWGNVERAGGRLLFGSDWPVVTSDVMRGLYIAVTRKTPEGTPPGGWLPGQAVSLDAALRHYTADPAWSAYAEDERGRIAPGRSADLVVLSNDLFAVPPEEILRTRVLLTLLDGRVVHRDPSFAATLGPQGTP